MHVVVAYDVRDDRVRERLRRLLWRYGLSPISKSVYAGRLSWDKALRLASRASEVLGPSDSLVVIPVQDGDFRRAVVATRLSVQRRGPGDVVVIDGGVEGAGEGAGRGEGVQDQGLPDAQDGGEL